MLLERAGVDGARSRSRSSARRRLAIGALIATVTSSVIGARSAPVAAAPVEATPLDEPISFLVKGTGNGHGRGMSQWGAYGRAVNGGQSWQTILNAYYGGTQAGTVTNSDLRVRLLGADDAVTVGVISPVGRLRWSGANATSSIDYASVYAVETGSNRFDVFGTTNSLACPQDPTGNWTRLATSIPGPITFRSRSTPATAPASSTLGLCGGSDGIVQYRGAIEVRDTQVGNRVINVVPVESYLRGVVPREVIASWGNSAAGMNALKAQSVAARSYALSQNRYSYAETCDTAACQVYEGAAVRSSPGGTSTVREHPHTDTAIEATAGVVRRWPDGRIVATEFSSSNGPRTAGGVFPPVDDPYDAVSGNNYHTWTRTISADEVAAAYGLSSLAGVRTERDPSSSYDGIWANLVRLSSTSTVSAWAFRNRFGLPSPGFTLRPVFATVSSCMPARFDTFAMVGDSVGIQVAGSPNDPLRTRIDEAFRSETYDVLKNRATQYGSVDDGVAAAGRVPVGTELVVIELGYNDSPEYLDGRIDRLMSVLRARSVGQVLWVNLSERRRRYRRSNLELDRAASRWSNLAILDWRSASAAHDDWFVDGVHLTAAGRVGFGAFLTQHIAQAAGVKSGSCLTWRTARVAAKVTTRVPLLGRAGVPASLSQVKGVALNVTVVGPAGSGFVKVWECGKRQPTTASVNFQRGNTTPNMVILPLSKTGRVCIWSLTDADVVIDISGWFDRNSGVRVATGRLVDTRSAKRVEKGKPIRVPVRGRLGIPRTKSEVQAVSLNVAAVDGVGAGYLTVWECGQRRPSTASVNFGLRKAASNAVVVPLRGSGEVCIEPSVPVHTVVDVTGWFDNGADVHPVEKRLHDSRSSEGRLGANRQRRISNSPQVRIANGTVTGVIYNVVAVRPNGFGHLRAWRCGSGKPPTAAVNFRPQTAIPNAILLSIAGDESLCVWTTHNTDLVVDAVAAFGASSGLHSASARLFDSRFAIR